MIPFPLPLRGLSVKYPYSAPVVRGLVLALGSICTLGSIDCRAADPPRLTDDRGIVLQNNQARIVFDQARGALVSLEDLAADHQHRTADPAGPLWSLTLSDGQMIDPTQAEQFTATSSEDRTSVALCWTRFSNRSVPPLSVTANIEMPPDGQNSKWRIVVNGLGDSSVRSLQYPRITQIAPQQRETLAVPVWMGEQTRQARQVLNPAGSAGLRHAWSYPGLLSLQCLALFQEHGPGLLISTDDTAALRKEFAVFGDGAGGLSCEVVHVPAVADKTGTLALSYAVQVTLFQGDWYSAAAHYRHWAHRQWWVEQSRVRRELSPPWVRETGLWVWNRGRSPGVLPPALALQKSLGVPVSVFWHWWHGCPYDAGFPEYLPPREGSEAMRDAVAAAHREQLHCIVYMNQRLWGMSTRSWVEEGAERFAVKNPDGSVTPEVYNTFMKVPCASMCMGTEFWRDKYATLATQAVNELGVDGIYMDQACSSLACYDSTHGHPLGGGAWWMEGFQILQRDIRQRCADCKPVALAGEGCGEAWLPHLDLMLSLQVSMERYAAPGIWEPIPMFHAVYHDCAVMYGNYCSLTRPPYDDLWPKEYAPQQPLTLLDAKFAQQFRLEQGRAFVWGQQPTIANFQPEQFAARPAELDFLSRIVRLRQNARQYLLDGTFLRPPSVDGGETNIPMSRLSIYAGQQDAVQEYMRVTDNVLTGAYQAADGSVAVALVNVSDQPVTIQLQLTGDDYPLAPQGVVRRLLEQQSTETGTYRDATAILQLQLDPADVRIYEFIASERDAN